MKSSEKNSQKMFPLQCLQCCGNKKINYLVHEYFEASGHVQTRPMHQENTCPDTSYAPREYMSGHVQCSKGF